MEDLDSAERMRAQQVSLVFGQTLRNQALSPVIGALLCVPLWPVADRRLLVGWIAALAAVSVWRHLLARAYHAQAPAGPLVRAWERRFLASLGVASATWGIGGSLAMPQLSEAHQALIYCFLLGMAGGTSALYAAHGSSVALAMSLIMGPATLYLLAAGGTLRVVLAVGGIIFIVAASRAVQQMNNALRRNLELARDLEQLARTDPLSGLANRRAFAEFGQAVVANAARSARPCALLMIDADEFKSINDRLGHASGDAVIRSLGAILAEATRSGERAGRLGGEEFAVILPDADLGQARALAERILERARTVRASVGATHIDVTVSIGVAASDGVPRTFDALLARADAALYEAKRRGKDRIVVAEPGPGVSSTR